MGRRVDRRRQRPRPTLQRRFHLGGGDPVDEALDALRRELERNRIAAAQHADDLGQPFGRLSRAPRSRAAAPQ